MMRIMQAGEFRPEDFKTPPIQAGNDIEEKVDAILRRGVMNSNANNIQKLCKALDLSDGLPVLRDVHELLLLRDRRDPGH